MNQLKLIFPSIREREEVMADITSNKVLRKEFESWLESQQEQFLDFCTGARGVKILSDSFFKEVINPEYAPERLNEFLSVILKQRVKILHTLPNDSVRIASEGTLLVTDLVVELEDGSVVNLEVQRIGYKFPGERAACYSADLLLRQYKRLRDKKNKDFVYKDIQPVYTIVLFEKSPGEFHKFPDKYIHYVEAKADSGLKMNLLQKYIFIPLDIFRERLHNEDIKNETEAWLTFFSTDSPEKIVRLVTSYPRFKTMYQDIYDICLNTERVMGMFSKELQILDRNTTQYMMDEMQKELDEKEEALKEMDRAIEEKTRAIEEKDARIRQLQKQLAQATGTK